MRMKDNVNNPEHYTAGGIECIDAIQAALTPEEFRGYCKGNALKYEWRERLKGGTESLKKARWYLDRLIQMDESFDNAEAIQAEVQKTIDLRQMIEDAPQWARWLAQDEYGEWWVFGNKPNAGDYSWVPDGYCYYDSVVKSEPNPNWRDTLTEIKR